LNYLELVNAKDSSDAIFILGCESTQEDLIKATKLVSRKENLSSFY
jgi:hypothetical protein